MASVSEILESVDRLPALPATVLRLIPLLSDDTSSVEDLLEIVGLDEALAMATMRLGNSAAFGAPRRVFTLRESVVRLGRRRLRALIMEQQTSPMFARAGSSFGLQRGELWRGALGGAFAAESLARAAGTEPPDLCFLCALLRDVGKIILDIHFGTAYQSRVKEQLAEGQTFIEAERRAVGYDHAELGASLAQRWRLPDRVVNAIRFHHDPPAEAPAHDPMIDLVHAADTICLWAGLAVGADGLCYRLAEHVRRSLNLHREGAESEIVSMCERLRQAETELGNGKSAEAAA